MNFLVSESLNHSSNAAWVCRPWMSCFPGLSGPVLNLVNLKLHNGLWASPSESCSSARLECTLPPSDTLLHQSQKFLPHRQAGERFTRSNLISEMPQKSNQAIQLQGRAELWDDLKCPWTRLARVTHEIAPISVAVQVSYSVEKLL